jgi:hypothetical protein
VRVLLFSFALLAVVEVVADAALVSNTLNWLGLAAVAGYSPVYLGLLVSSSLSKVIRHQSLESLSGVGVDLLSQNLHEVREEFAVKSARAIASSARKTFLVNLGAIASEADNRFVFFNGFLTFVRSQNLAVNFLFNGVSFELAGLRFSLDRAVAVYFLYVFLDLGGHVLGVDNSIQLLFVSSDGLGVYSHVLEVN